MTEIINWYDKIGANNNKKKLPSKWKNHHIYHNSMILCIGGTGTGKTNSLIDYISRSSGEFYKIIICSFSTLDEPLGALYLTIFILEAGHRCGCM